MINKLSIFISKDNLPYKNLAVEQYLTMHTGPDECILYLWQNDRTVVVGRNQNCWKECRVSLLESEGGFLARRLSGGGAVYHDMGNLNFTFCVRKENYDLDKQLQVIIRAVQKFGIRAEQNGRNDIITGDGKKFSGNAFYETGDFCYHHGTLLIHTDSQMMARYLSVSREKLQAKSIQSVQSRVVNLSELCPSVTVEFMKDKMVEAFEDVYHLKAASDSENRMDQSEIKENQKIFESWTWKYGRKSSFNQQMDKKYPWGDIHFEFMVKNGMIEDVNVYSDAMDQDFILRIAAELVGCRYNVSDMENQIVQCAGNNQTLLTMASDIGRLFTDNM